jgi:hypothetical protein
MNFKPCQLIGGSIQRPYPDNGLYRTTATGQRPVCNTTALQYNGPILQRHPMRQRL